MRSSALGFISLIVLIPFLLSGCIGAAEQAKRDQDKAQFEKVKALADKGDPDAEGKLSKMYLDGSGVKPDGEAAKYWLAKAATDGNHDAQKVLAHRCIATIPKDCDYATAFRWTKLAAEGGDQFSMVELATMYENGLGVVKDHELAEDWVDKFVEPFSDPADGYSEIMDQVLMTGVKAQIDDYKTLKRDENAEIELQFRYDGGRGRDVTVIKSTGSGLLDERAVTALQDSPLPPPPRSLTSDRLNVRFTFTFAEFGIEVLPR